MTETALLGLDTQRQAAQLAFVASGENIEVGSVGEIPWTIAALSQIQGDEAWVVQRLDAGLTALVYRLRSSDGDWTLKRARAQALVRNIDGQTSFLNEVQRRADIERLKRMPGGELRWAALVDTRYASFRDGIILSPWIDGEIVREWDERRIRQVLQTACSLWLEGLFEWDLCPGNILDDGAQIKLFDFGYMFRFDPLHRFNSAGSGQDQPMFHPAERFETRNFCAYLLQLSRTQGEAAALQSFRQEKDIAIACYQQMRSAIAERGASGTVLSWLDDILKRWTGAMRSGGSELFLVENWRSHVLDLHDDLSGQSCTPGTLLRADWLIATLREHYAALQSHQAFFWGDVGLSRSELIAQYMAKRDLAVGWQLNIGK